MGLIYCRSCCHVPHHPVGLTASRDHTIWDRLSRSLSASLFISLSDCARTRICISRQLTVLGHNGRTLLGLVVLLPSVSKHGPLAQHASCCPFLAPSGSFSMLEGLFSQQSLKYYNCAFCHGYCGPGRFYLYLRYYTHLPIYPFTFLRPLTAAAAAAASSSPSLCLASCSFWAHWLRLAGSFLVFAVFPFCYAKRLFTQSKIRK